MDKQFNDILATIGNTGTGRDHVSFHEGNRERVIRRVLKSHPDTNTIPQIYIGGTYVGGATGIYAVGNEGQVQSLLDGANVNFKNANPDFDANNY